ncbi:MAG: zinc-ribbon domain containing protein [Patescibacteria group bacterium]
MKKTCKRCGQEFPIYDEDLEFYKKVGVEVPTLCPACRQQRRLSFRNERKLYHRKCDYSGKQIISIYSPEKPYKVFAQDIWWSDVWDPLDYGVAFDFSRPFFEQFEELQLKVPRLALYQKNVENSAYTNHTENLKNCYLCVDTGDSEDICYSKWIISSRDLVDCYQLEKAELCYESLYSVGDYNCVHIYLSDNCRDSAFLFDCRDCSDCFMCANLRNKKFCILNKQYSEEDYQKIRGEIDLGSYKTLKEFRQKFIEFVDEKAVHRDQTLIQSEDCSGDMIYQCKNVKDSFEVINSQDCRYCYDAGHSKDCYDTYEQAFNCERQYECHACNRGQFLIGCSVSYDVSDCFYSEMCHNSANLFGCIGLRHKQYCILNKQYSKEEYEELLPKIITLMRAPASAGGGRENQEWGEFFPASLSCFDYEETLAQEYFPQGVLCCPKEIKFENTEIYRGPIYEIPDHIKNVDESICSKVLICEVSAKPYKIIPLELEIYKKLGVAIPRRCPDQRHLDRMALRNFRKLVEGKCGNCKKKILTACDLIKQVYCEECYLKFIK